MRELRAKHGKKKPCGGNNSKDPSGCGRQRWQANVAKLHSMALQVALNQPNAKHNDGNPPIVYADRNPVDARNLELLVEHLSKTHSRLKKVVNRAKEGSLDPDSVHR